MNTGATSLAEIMADFKTAHDEGQHCQAPTPIVNVKSIVSRPTSLKRVEFFAILMIALALALAMSQGFLASAPLITGARRAASESNGNRQARFESEFPERGVSASSNGGIVVRNEGKESGRKAGAHVSKRRVERKIIKSKLGNKVKSKLRNRRRFRSRRRSGLKVRSKAEFKQRRLHNESKINLRTNGDEQLNLKLAHKREAKSEAKEELEIKSVQVTDITSGFNNESHANLNSEPELASETKQYAELNSAKSGQQDDSQLEEREEQQHNAESLQKASGGRPFVYEDEARKNDLKDKAKRRLLWCMPRSDGFNNQLITVYEGIRCAQRLGRTLVLPLMYENVRYDTNINGSGPYPFEEYFETNALSRIVSVITPAQLMLEGGPRCEGRVFFAQDRKQKLSKVYKDRFNLTFEHIRYLQGRDGAFLRKSAPCVDDSACTSAMYTRSDELGPYSNYATAGQGYSLASPRMRAIRAAFVPTPVVHEIANAVLLHIGPHVAFNAIHVRRGDYREKCKQLARECEVFGSNSMLQSKAHIQAGIAALAHPSLPLFVSTTHTAECRALLAVTDLRLVFMDDVKLPRRFEWTATRPDILSIASQIVASRALHFIGNRFSSYSSTINYFRLLRNKDEQMLFF